MKKIGIILLSFNLISGALSANHICGSKYCDSMNNSGIYTSNLNKSASEKRVNNQFACKQEMANTVPSYFLFPNLTQKSPSRNCNKMVLGGIIRGDSSRKKIALVFTGHEFADGGSVICKTLKHNHVKGSFFLTGDFYRAYPGLVKRLQKEGHYLGPHSDKHILYADWLKRDSTLVSQDIFCKDLKDNYKAMTNAGIKIPKLRFFLPSYEWYNEDISLWCSEMGVQLINFTPGTTSNSDYTIPQMKNYRSSEEIYNNIMNYEMANSLNGFMLLIHIGTAPERTDKLYNCLDMIINHLKILGYQFVSVDKLL